MTVYIGRYTLTVEYQKGSLNGEPSIHRGSCAGATLHAALKAAEDQAYSHFGFLSASCTPWDAAIKKLTVSAAKRG